MRDAEDRAACGTIPLTEATELFFPAAEGGKLAARTTKWPKPDNHGEPRALCAACPLIGRCLAEALVDDGYTFRVLSAEERAAFGGMRPKAVRIRDVYLTQGQVLNRIVEAGYPLTPVMAALAGHARRLAADSTLAAFLAAPPAAWAWLDHVPADVRWGEEPVKVLAGVLQVRFSRSA